MIEKYSKDNVIMFEIGDEFFILDKKKQYFLDFYIEFFTALKDHSISYEIRNPSKYDLIDFNESRVSASISHIGIRAEYYSGNRYIDKDYNIADFIKFLKRRKKQYE